MLQPLFNKCKIEIIDDYAGIQRPDTGDNLQKGILVAANLVPDHLTASTGYEILDTEKYQSLLADSIGSVVYYEQYADSGTVIEEEGKQYAFVPFYRLIAIEE